VSIFEEEIEKDIDTLNGGASSMPYSCAAGGTPFSVTWAAWASDIFEGLDDWDEG
jgi:hypothetical protein